MPPPWLSNKYGPVPSDFPYVIDVLTALDNEAREKVNESHEGKRKTESLTPLLQINWQRSRYIYDLYHLHHKISKKLYDYCILSKIIDGPLCAKWRKPGYEILCSTYVITSSNYKFGGTSICRVPRKERSGDNKDIVDANTGCRGCASGSSFEGNIFGNKYGQRLAGVQVARERREVKVKKIMEEEKRRKALAGNGNGGGGGDGGEKGDSDTDSDDEGPGPAPAVKDSEVEKGDSDTDTDSDDDDDGPQQSKDVWGDERLVEEGKVLEDEAVDAKKNGIEQEEDGRKGKRAKR